MEIENIFKSFIMFSEKVEKPWGYEQHSRHQNIPYTIKILSINRDHRLSLQYHENKLETILVIEGELLLVIGPQGDVDYPDATGKLREEHLRTGDVYDVFPRTIHRYCSFNGSCKLLEVSIGEDTDIVRLQDDYKREGTTAP